MNNNKNPNLYEELDNTIMRGVNAGVRAWNWTTGRTKADLANNLIGISAIGVGVGTLDDINYYPVLACGLAGLWIGICHYCGKANDVLEIAELKALEKSLKDIDVENEKDAIKYPAPITLGYGIFSGITDPHRCEIHNPSNAGMYALAIGFISMGASLYIMRADYLPTRKDCVRRGLEKLAEKLKEIEIPTPKPVPVPSMGCQVI